MHLDALLFISNNLFGEDYYTPEDFRKLNKESILRVATLNGEVVGYFVFKILKENTVGYLDVQSTSKFLEVKTIAVHPAHQGKGLGTFIFNNTTNIAKEFNVENCYCVAWQRNGKVAMHNIHINAGFQVVKNISNYWRLDSIQKGYDCPECGNPCVCNAVIYHKRIQ